MRVIGGGRGEEGIKLPNWIGLWSVNEGLDGMASKVDWVALFGGSEIEDWVAFIGGGRVRTGRRFWVVILRG